MLLLQIPLQPTSERSEETGEIFMSHPTKAPIAPLSLTLPGSTRHFYKNDKQCYQMLLIRKKDL